mgnify:CR=1 FL=1
MTAQLTRSHRATHAALFRHPAARNLHWRDVRSLLTCLADVVAEPNGSLKVTRGGQTLVLRPTRIKDVAEISELMAIRHFLERSGAVPPEGVADGTHLLVVIDHREARIYKADLHGSVPQRITPYDPHGFGRYLHHVETGSSGQRKPERKSFYEAVAKTLYGAAKVLIFGSSTGASSAMEQLLTHLARHRPNVAKRIVGAVVLDEQHMTEDQLLARARDFYVNAAS